MREAVPRLESSGPNRVRESRMRSPETDGSGCLAMALHLIELVVAFTHLVPAQPIRNSLAGDTAR
jgi:hypothetical protein